MAQTVQTPGVDLDTLRRAIQAEYAVVAAEPEHGFHFHTGRRLADMLGYKASWLEGIPEPTIASFAGTGNPFGLGALDPGQQIVDVGCGGGIDSLIAARMVGPGGHVIGVDMNPAMLAKARDSATAAGLANVEFRQGFGEALPVENEWADVVISNGVLNLMPDKDAALRQMARAPKPTAADRRHPGSDGGAAVRQGGHRTLDRLNCRRSPGGGARVGRRGGRLRRFRDHMAG
jgi:arsenite methyltransferase